MSRLTITLSLVAALTTSALADRVEPVASMPYHAGLKFAEPPSNSDRDFAPRLDRAALRAKLAANRKANLNHFRAYVRKGVFPSNTYTDSKLNVWLDADGNLCAAATVIKASGQADLVMRVADQNNFIRLADVTQGPLLDWILTSGFTQDEIDAIQEPMMPVSREPVLDPAPVEPVLVDNRMRKFENRRLNAKYKQVDRMLMKNARSSLDTAVDRLMARPDLAYQLLGALDG